MEPTTQPTKKTIREQMPPNFLPTLAKQTGLDKTTIYRAVKTENKRSKAWPHIIKLATKYQEQLEQEEALLGYPQVVV